MSQVRASARAITRQDIEFVRTEVPTETDHFPRPLAMSALKGRLNLSAVEPFQRRQFPMVRHLATNH
jgi:hypothetical protein